MICRSPWQLRQYIACNNATDIELQVHTYAVGVADIAAHEGLPHNVVHLSSYASVGGAPEAYGSHRVFVSESFSEIAVRIFSAIAEN